jgi:transketolase
VWRWHNAAVAGQVANYVSYGVREFGMAAIMNGVAAASAA